MASTRLLSLFVSHGAPTDALKTERFEPFFVTIWGGLPGDGPGTLHAGFPCGNLSVRTFALAPTHDRQEKT